MGSIFSDFFFSLEEEEFLLEMVPSPIFTLGISNYSLCKWTLSHPSFDRCAFFYPKEEENINLLPASSS